MSNILGERFYSVETVRLVLSLRFAAGVGLLLPFPIAATTVALVVVLLSSVYLFRRAIFGGDGADQMGVVSAAGLLLICIGLLIDDKLMSYAGMFFIAGQAALAYFFAGAAKLVSPIWRCGDALLGVMRTQSYGHPDAEQIALHNPRLRSFLCWFVFGTEILFPLVFFAPPYIAIAALICYGFFHCVNAYYMGLNAFVFPFISTYPSVLFVNYLIRSWIGLS